MGCGAPCGSKTPITQKRLQVALRDVEEQLQEMQTRVLGSEQVNAASSEAHAEQARQVNAEMEERWAENTRELTQRCKKNEEFSQKELQTYQKKFTILESGVAEASDANDKTEYQYAKYREETVAQLEAIEAKARTTALETSEQESRITSLYRERDASIAQFHEARESLWGEALKRENAERELVRLRKRFADSEEKEEQTAQEHFEAKGRSSAYEQILQHQCNELRQERNGISEQRDSALMERDAAIGHCRKLAYDHGRDLAFENGQTEGLQNSLTSIKGQLRREREQVIKLHEAAAVSAKSSAARAAATYLNCMPGGGLSRTHMDEVLANDPGPTAGFLSSLNETKLQLRQERDTIDRLNKALTIPLTSSKDSRTMRSMSGALV